MARVVIAPGAAADLDQLIRVLQLPRDSRSRIKTSLEQLVQFPEAGEELWGRWDGFRFILGPWRWMLIVYVFDRAADQVNVVTIQDARSGSSATSKR